MIRRKIQLANIDLNLLVALQALIATRSVTLAAQRVGVTQSAMSHSLRRLRVLLGDDVLVRSNNRMITTPIAESMLEALTSQLLQLQAILHSTEQFEPTHASRCFRVCASDHAHLCFASRLVAEVGRDAPAVTLHFTGYAGALATSALMAGNLDVIVSSELSEAPELTVRQLLSKERWHFVMRADHPRIHEPLDVAAYAAFSHVDVGPADGRAGLVDELLTSHGLQRRVALRLQSFSSAMLVLMRSDYVLVAPEGVVNVYRRILPLHVVEPPLELPPLLTFMYWHERTNDDPAVRWLRGAIARLFGA